MKYTKTARKSVASIKGGEMWLTLRAGVGGAVTAVTALLIGGCEEQLSERFNQIRYCWRAIILAGREMQKTGEATWKEVEITAPVVRMVGLPKSVAGKIKAFFEQLSDDDPFPVVTIRGISQPGSMKPATEVSIMEARKTEEEIDALVALTGWSPLEHQEDLPF